MCILLELRKLEMVCACVRAPSCAHACFQEEEGGSVGRSFALIGSYAYPSGVLVFILLCQKDIDAKIAPIMSVNLPFFAVFSSWMYGRSSSLCSFSGFTHPK